MAKKLGRKLRINLGGKTAAVTVILAGGLEDPEVLFIKRKRRRGDPWSGQIAFPGGRKKRYERDLLSTAIREAREEVGIVLREEDFLGVLGIFSPKNAPEIRVAAYVTHLREMPKVVISEGEVEKYFWIRLRELPKCEEIRSMPTSRGLWRGVTYECEGELIWGMTARIVKRLLTIYDFR